MLGSQHAIALPCGLGDIMLVVMELSRRPMNVPLREIVSIGKQTGVISCGFVHSARRALHQTAQQIQSWTFSMLPAQSEPHKLTQTKPPRGWYAVLFESERGEGSSESLSQYDLEAFLWVVLIPKSWRWVHGRHPCRSSRSPRRFKETWHKTDGKRAIYDFRSSGKVSDMVQRNPEIAHPGYRTKNIHTITRHEAKILLPKRIQLLRVYLNKVISLGFYGNSDSWFRAGVQKLDSRSTLRTYHWCRHRQGCQHTRPPTSKA